MVACGRALGGPARNLQRQSGAEQEVGGQALASTVQVALVLWSQAPAEASGCQRHVSRTRVRRKGPRLHPPILLSGAPMGAAGDTEGIAQIL